MCSRRQRFTSRLILIALVLTGTCLKAETFPWVFLLPRHDTRDAEMQAWDEEDSQACLSTFNHSGIFPGQPFIWQRRPVAEVLESAAPFAELRFDAAHPMELDGDEKKALSEWLRRGGFLLLIEDAYPYSQAELRSQPTLPVFEFFTRELPASDPGFSVSRVGDGHPIFHIFYQTWTVDSVAREMKENAHYRGRTLITYQGRPVAFFMGRYWREEEGRWLAAPRPLPRNFSLDIKSYKLTLNLYIYAIIGIAESSEIGTSEIAGPHRERPEKPDSPDR